MDHDKNLVVFLEKCDLSGVRMNEDKLKLRMQQAPFTWHVATDKGLRADHAKVGVILKMPPRKMWPAYNDSLAWFNTPVSFCPICRTLLSL